MPAMTVQSAVLGVSQGGPDRSGPERLAKISPRFATTSVVKLKDVASEALSQPHIAER